MPEMEFTLRPLIAPEAFEKMYAAAMNIFPNENIAGIEFTTNLGPTAPFNMPDGALKSITTNQYYAPALKSLTDHPYIEVKTFKLDLQRNSWLRYTSKDQITATLTLFVNDPNAYNSLVLGASAKLHKLFNFIRISEILAAHLPAAERDRLKYYEASLRDLTSNAERLDRAATDQVVKQQDQYQKRLDELEKQHTQRMDVQRQEHDAKLAAVQAHESSVLKKESELDLRESTAVRRELLKEIRTVIKATKKEDFISDRATEKRKVIHAVCGTVLIGSAILLAASAISILRAGNPVGWHLVPALSISAGIFASTLIFYLRWTNHWFADLASAEMRDRKFEDDILRASWLVELVFEWEKEPKDREFPAPVIQALTEGLFRDITRPPPDHHPLGTLQKLLGRVAVIKLTKDGLEISQSPKLLKPKE